MSGAVSWAESVSSREIQIGDGLVLVPEPGDDQPIRGDPRETQTLLEAVDRAMSRRRLIWGIDWLYPGLTMVVSRAPDPKLYFTVNRRHGKHEAKESTSRLIIRRAVLPLLLGVNLKLATLAPILVAGLLILLKKALVLSKLSLLVTGLTLFRGQGGTDSSSTSINGNDPIYGGGGLGMYGGYRDNIPEDVWFNRDSSETFTNHTFIY